MRFLWIAFIFLLGCTPKYLSERELIAYANDPDNGLSHRIERNGIGITISYRCTDLIILQDVGQNPTKQAYVDAMNKYKNYLYFTVTMDVQGNNALYAMSASMDQYNEYVRMLTFGMADKMRLVTETADTLGVLDYIFEGASLAGPNNMLVVFDQKAVEGTESFSFQLNDFGLNTGLIKQPFNCSNIARAPQLIDFKDFRP